MGRRGPKPVDLKMLQFWEREWWYAFRFLREGQHEPSLTRWRYELPAFANPRARGEIVSWKRPQITIRGRQDIWDALLAARSPQQLRKVGNRWQNWLDELTGKKLFERARAAGILDRPREEWPTELKQAVKVNPSGPAGFPGPMYVHQYARQFLAAISDKRFPRRRASADDARLDFLARSMAGVVCNKSPATGEDRLRRIQHKETDKNHVEQCWRCSLVRSEKLKRAEFYELMRQHSEEFEKENARQDQAFYLALAMHPGWTLLTITESTPNSGRWVAKFRDAEGQEHTERFFLKKENRR